NENAVRAVAHALCHELPNGWRDDLLRAFRSRRELVPLWAKVIGYRRFPFGDVLRNELATKDSLGKAELAWALGRVGTPASLPVLSSVVDSDDERVGEAAAIALMRLGDDRPLQQAMQAARTHSWSRRVLGIGGNPRSVRHMLDALTAQRPDADTVIALGLLGDL